MTWNELGGENDAWILSFTFKYFSLKFSFQFKLSSPPSCERKIWELFLLEVWRERAWGPGETRVGAFNGVLKLAHTGSWELMVNISQLCIQWHHIDSLKLAGMGEFIPQNLANSTNQGLFFSPLWNPVVKYLPTQHCLRPTNSSYLPPTYLTYNADSGME